MKTRDDFLVLGGSEIDQSSQIMKGAVIGKPFRKLLEGEWKHNEQTIIAENTYIGYYSVIGGGSKIRAGTIIDDHCIIESEVGIGEKTLVIYKAQICNEAQIGNNCIIGGFIGERTLVGNNCRIFGQLIHNQYNPLLGWDSDEATENSAVIEDGVFIGFNAMVIGEVKIKKRAYICAGAIVTKDVPALSIVTGVNKIQCNSQWSGRLSASNFFYTED